MQTPTETHTQQVGGGITAVVPVRAGSQRVADKNLRPFAGTTLLDIKLCALLRVPELDRIVVNTDSDRAIAIAQRYADSTGGRVAWHRREPYYASSACTGSEFFRHLGQTTPCRLFVYAPCTSPLVRPETVSRCIQLYEEQAGATCDCVSTVSPVKEFLWQNGRPLNYDPAHAPNSQDLPPIAALNFGCTVIARDLLVARSNIIGLHPLFVETTGAEAIDIDTPLDFFIAEQLCKRQAEESM